VRYPVDERSATRFFHFPTAGVCTVTKTARDFAPAPRFLLYLTPGMDNYEHDVAPRLKASGADDHLGPFGSYQQFLVQDRLYFASF
jgi:hypothetical protein